MRTSRAHSAVRGAPQSRSHSRAGGSGATTSTAGAPSAASAGGAPTGRVEMLAWLEVRSGRTVEAIEGLRDGISYAFVLADIIATAAGVSVSSRRQSAYDTVDTKIDKRIGPTVLGQAPPQDSIQITEACERNLLALQAMIRSCVPKRFGMEMDVRGDAGPHAFS